MAKSTTLTAQKTNSHRAYETSPATPVAFTCMINGLSNHITEQNIERQSDFESTLKIMELSHGGTQTFDIRFSFSGWVFVWMSRSRGTV
jgi:hypothetical protein